MSKTVELARRLYEHADVHAADAAGDAEQKQWEADLRVAASKLEQMELALRIIWTWSQHPERFDCRHAAAQCANALGEIV